MVNDTLSSLAVTVDVGWWRLDGTARELTTHHLALAANSMYEVTSSPLPAAAERDPRQWVYAAVLRPRMVHSMTNPSARSSPP